VAEGSTVVKVDQPKLWSPDSPTLYQLKVFMQDESGQELDRVESYAGIREVGKVKDKDGNWRFTLNGKTIFHWGPLDQGWWPDGLLTPPSEDAMLFEINFLKQAGFNMIRKHIKVEPRLYYYHCDRLGMLVWQDQVSGGPNPNWYRLDPTKNKNHSTPEPGDPIDAEWPDIAHKQWMAELKGMIDHLYNYPSIVMWVPFNEAWGQHRTMEVGEWIMKYDPSRSISIASGGNFAPVGDVADMHSYPHPAFPFHMNEYDDYIKVVGEFGGHGWKVDGHEWDPKKKNFIYGGMPETIDEYAERYAESIRLLGKLKKQGVSGGVYTQTTDVEGEINGLMTYDRKVIKIPAKELAGIHRQLFKPMAMADNAANLPKVSEEGIPKKQPNFIVILTDDQGWGTTSITVDPAVPESKSDFFKTPNLEKLASQGLRFTQAYSGHPNCSPSRAALLTGRSPAALHFTDICGRNGGGLYVGNKIIPPQHINALPEGELTLPEIIKQHLPAYKAAHFGKWHLGKVGPEGHGFDAGDGPTGNREGSGKDNLPDDPKRIFSVTKRANDWMAEQAKGKQPFYLQVSHYATHLGLQSRPETKQRVDKRPSGTRHQNTEFGAMIEDMDDGIGQLLAKVKELGIGDNTYIFYTADNGTFPLEEPGNINGPLRGNKATVWEAGVRVPFIIAGPGIKSGTVSRAPAVGYDIYPTICDILGIADLPEQVEGGSLQPVWAAKAASVKRSRPQLVFHWPHYQHQKKSIPDSTVLLDSYKLHYFWETGKAELYNLKTDLAETKDLSRSMPDKAKELEGLLHSHLKEINAQIPELNKDYDPATDPALVQVKKPKDNKKKKNRS
jgi:arylsulfatase A-like enzyme